MNNTFLTHLHTRSSSNAKIRNIPNINNHSVCITKNKGYIQAKQNIMDYMITEETEFVDLNKCKDYYTKSNFKLKEINNDFSGKIKSQKEKLKSLEMIIEQVFINYYKELINKIEINIKEVEEYYKNKIEEMKDEIIFKKKELTHYTKYENEKVKNNNFCKKKLNDELSNDVVNEKAYEKYQVIALNARRSLRSHEKNYNNLVEYEKNYRELYENEFEKKKNIYNFLDYQVYKTKSNNIGLENRIEHLKKLSKSLQEKIISDKKVLKNLIDEIRYIKRNLLLDRVTIYKLCRKFKAKTIDDVITIYNNVNILNENNSVQFRMLNKTISEYQDEIKQLINKKNSLKENDYQLLNNSDTATYSSFQENEPALSLDKNSTLIKQFIFFVDGSNRKMIKIINCIKKKKINLTNKPVSLEKLFFRMKSIDFAVVKNILKMVTEFIKNIYFLYYHFISNLSLMIDSESRRTYSHRSNFVIDLNSNNIQHLMEDQSKTALFRLEKKNKFLARTEVEIFQYNQIISQDDRKKKDQVVKSKKSIESVFQNFYEFDKKNMKNSDLKNDTCLGLLKPKIIKHISGFTNDFVIKIGENNLCKKMQKNPKPLIKIKIPNILKEKKFQKLLLDRLTHFISETKNHSDLIEEPRLNTDFNVSKSKPKRRMILCI